MEPKGLNARAFDCFAQMSIILRYQCCLLLLVTSILNGCTTTDLTVRDDSSNSVDAMMREGDYEAVVAIIDKLVPSGTYESIAQHVEASSGRDLALRKLPSITKNHSDPPQWQANNLAEDLYWYQYYAGYYAQALAELGRFEEALAFTIDVQQKSQRILSAVKRIDLSIAEEKYIPTALEIILRVEMVSRFALGEPIDDIQQRLDSWVKQATQDKNILENNQLFRDYSEDISDAKSALIFYLQVLNDDELLSPLENNSGYVAALQGFEGLINTQIRLGKLEFAAQEFEKLQERTALKLVLRLQDSLLTFFPKFGGPPAIFDTLAGVLSSLLRDFPSASNAFEKARKKVDKLNLDSHHVYDRYAWSSFYASYGIYYLGLQQRYEEALEYINKSLAIMPRGYLHNFFPMASYQAVLVHAAEINQILGNHREASALLERAADYARKINDQLILARITSLKAETLFEKQEYEGAAELFSEALLLVGDSKNTENWRLHYGLGQIYTQQNENERALQHYLLAVEQVEALWSGQLKNAEKQLSFMGSRLAVYGPAVKMLIEQGDFIQAIELMEKSKARTLSQSGVYALDNLRDESVLDFQAIRSLIPANAGLLIYHVGESNVSLAFVSETQLIAKNLALSPAELFSEINEYRAALQTRSANVNQLSAGLYKRLIAPVADAVSSIEHLVIVPHGELHYVPFQALAAGEIRADGQPSIDPVASQLADVPNHRGLIIKGRDKSAAYEALEPQQYLAVTHRISYAPSLTTLAKSIEKPRRQLASRQLLAAGAPPALHIALGDGEIEHFPKLSHAKQELESVAELFPSHKILTGRMATESAVKRQMENYSAVLIAAHGVLDRQEPQNSGILLSKDRANDGKLTVSEIAHMRLRADIVALSACDTGVVNSYAGLARNTSTAHLPAGDDLVSLNRAFMSAGAASVLSTLWSVEDESTAALMTHFFREYTDGRTKAEAMRQAQRQLMDDVQWAHPYYWAPFTLNGGW